MEGSKSFASGIRNGLNERKVRIDVELKTNTCFRCNYRRPKSFLQHSESIERLRS